MYMKKWQERAPYHFARIRESVCISTGKERVEHVGVVLAEQCGKTGKLQFA